MMFVRIPAIGLIGGLFFGICGLIPFLSSANLTDSRVREIDSAKTGIPIVDPSPLSDHDFGATQVKSRDADSFDQTLATKSESTLCEKVTRLKRGLEFLQEVPDYSAILRKQEFVKSDLLDEQTILIKCRHKPFSVYLNWLTVEAGREVLYVDGKNHGKMIAHDGGWKARIPAFSLDTDGLLAMRDARYPVTTAGLVGLIQIMLGVHQQDLVQSNFATCEAETGRMFDGRICDMFTTKYKSPEESPIYRKSITLIDREWNVPLQSRHFEWPKPQLPIAECDLDQATLIESYSFTEVQLRCNLTDHDFDRTNPEYRFR